MRKSKQDDRVGYFSDDSRYSDYHYTGDRRNEMSRNKKRKDSLDKYVEDEIAHYIQQEREREARERERQRRKMKEEEEERVKENVGKAIRHAFRRSLS